MAQQQFSGAPTSDMGTPDLYWGTWGQGLLSEWWETAPQLIWPEAVITYGRMRHDPQCKGVLSAYKLPLMRATWAIDPAGCRDEVVQLCSEDLDLPILGNADDDSWNADNDGQPARTSGVTWKRHLSQVLQYLEFGHMIFERKYQIVGDQLRLLALGERMPWTVARIMLNQDATINHLVQYMQEKPIPANRLVWYAHEHEGANWAGFSLLRSAFAPWLLKHECWRVLATSIRRFGMGVPTVEAPPGATQNQVQQASSLASSMRVGDMSGVGLPSGFKFSLAGLTGNVPDSLAFIQYLDGQIAKQALAGLMELGDTQNGSRALGETFLDLFLLSLQGVADEIATAATVGWPQMPGILADLVAWNWGADEPVPKIVCTDVGENYEVSAQAIDQLVQHGALDPDPTLDAWIRKAWRLPARDPDAPSSLPPKPGPPLGPEPGPGGGPAGDQAPASQGQAGTAASRRSGRHRAAAPGGFRRQPTQIEAASGFDPAMVRQEWLDARTALIASYKLQVLGGLQDDLAGQVEASVQAGQLGKLASLTVDTDAAATLIGGAMLGLARTAANRARAEAASQGVKIPAAGVALPEAKIGQVAAARAGLLGSWWAQQASGKALQVSAAAAHPPLPVRLPADIADLIREFLEGLSDASLTDQLGAALTAGQNVGRISVMEAAAASGGTAQYVATEIEDDNTCKPCQDEDQRVFASLAGAQAAYPSGGYIGCLGGMRCRGTVIAYWGGLTP
jgi:hypothetical protein